MHKVGLSPTLTRWRTNKLEKIEILRGFASLYVFAGHVFITSIGALGLVLRFGQEMVMCFFLLSGFVIYYATAKAGHTNFRAYFIHRFRRIYPILLIALLISYLVAAWGGDPRIDERTLAGNIFMLQDFRFGKPGVWFDTFEGNLPLWSLSYEWWFYMMFFPIYVYVPARYQLALVTALSLAGLVSYVIFPNQVSLFLLYFILWWTGLEFARTYCQGVTPTFFTQRHSLIILASFCFLVPVAMIIFMPRPAIWSYGLHPILEIRHFGACLILATAALFWSQVRWRFFHPILSVFAKVAPISYALYAFHYPLCILSRGKHWEIPSPVQQVAAILLTFVLAYLAEVRLQKSIVRWTNRFF